MSKLDMILMLGFIHVWCEKDVSHLSKKLIIKCNNAGFTSMIVHEAQPDEMQRIALQSFFSSN